MACLAGHMMHITLHVNIQGHMQVYLIAVPYMKSNLCLSPSEFMVGPHTNKIVGSCSNFIVEKTLQLFFEGFQEARQPPFHIDAGVSRPRIRR